MTPEGTLVEFLLARTAEDEAAYQGAMHMGCVEDDSDGANVIHSATCPNRVLAECEAKRQIAEHHARVQWDDGELGCAVCGIDILPPADGVQVRDAAGWPCPTLRWLALPYADHPDYMQEWRP